MVAGHAITIKEQEQLVGTREYRYMITATLNALGQEFNYDYSTAQAIVDIEIKNLGMEPDDVDVDGLRKIVNSLVNTFGNGNGTSYQIEDRLWKQLSNLRKKDAHPYLT